LQEFRATEGAAIEERTTELISPFIEMQRNVKIYLEGTVKDGWAGFNGKSLMDAFLFVTALIGDGHIRQQEVKQQEVDLDDDVCPSCGSEKYVRFNDGTTGCFDCIPRDDEITKDEVEEIVDELEMEGLVEWTGAYRQAPNGALEKVYEKRQLH
jgi:hypothetical protein